MRRGSRERLHRAVAALGISSGTVAKRLVKLSGSDAGLDIESDLNR